MIEKLKPRHYPIDECECCKALEAELASMTRRAEEAERIEKLAHERVAELEARIEGMIEPYTDEQKRIASLGKALAKEKGGWDAFYKLRKSVGEDRYPGLTGEVKAVSAETGGQSKTQGTASSGETPQDQPRPCTRPIYDKYQYQQTPIGSGQMPSKSWDCNCDSLGCPYCSQAKQPAETKGKQS